MDNAHTVRLRRVCQVDNLRRLALFDEDCIVIIDFDILGIPTRLQ